MPNGVSHHFGGALTYLKRYHQGGPGSVRFGYGLGRDRFKRFRFSVLAVPLQNRFFVFQYSLTGKNGSGFGSWETGSGSVPEPPCIMWYGVYRSERFAVSRDTRPLSIRRCFSVCLSLWLSQGELDPGGPTLSQVLVPLSN